MNDDRFLTKQMIAQTVQHVEANVPQNLHNAHMHALSFLYLSHLRNQRNNINMRFNNNVNVQQQQHGNSNWDGRFSGQTGIVQHGGIDGRNSTVNGSSNLGRQNNVRNNNLSLGRTKR